MPSASAGWCRPWCLVTTRRRSTRSTAGARTSARRRSSSTRSAMPSSRAGDRFCAAGHLLHAGHLQRAGLLPRLAPLPVRHRRPAELADADGRRARQCVPRDLADPQPAPAQTSIGSQQFRADAPTSIYVSNVTQCCEAATPTASRDPTDVTHFPWLLSLWNFETKGMGSSSNMKHSFYIEGRPDSTFELNNVRVMGSRARRASSRRDSMCLCATR